MAPTGTTKYIVHFYSSNELTNTALLKFEKDLKGARNIQLSPEGEVKSGAYIPRREEGGGGGDRGIVVLLFTQSVGWKKYNFLQIKSVTY